MKIEREGERRGDAVALRRLGLCFAANGCIREPNPDRLAEGHRAYKKGWEVRIVLESQAEAEEVRQWVIRVGLRPGLRYRKGSRWIQPIYGFEAVRLIRAAGRRASRERSA